MKPLDCRINVNIGINVTLWQAIKLRIAGKNIREYVEGMLKEVLDNRREERNQ